MFDEMNGAQLLFSVGKALVSWFLLEHDDVIKYDDCNSLTLLN
jgi:hypothetical protein